MISKSMLRSPSLILTLNRGTNISFEELRHKTGGWIWKTPFALCLLWWRFHSNSFILFLISVVVICKSVPWFKSSSAAVLAASLDWLGPHGSVQVSTLCKSSSAVVLAASDDAANDHWNLYYRALFGLFNYLSGSWRR